MKVALLSDTHISAAGRAFNANLRTALDWIEGVNPFCIVHLGDVTAEASDRPEQIGLAARMLGDLHCPLHLVPGNHDIGDNPSTRGLPATHPFNQERLEEYRQVLGPDYWCLQVAGWRLIGLNSILFCTGSTDEERQFAWLESRLDKFEGPVGLMLHKPLFFAHPDDNPAHDRYVPLESRGRLLKLLQAHNLEFVLSGHVHQAREVTVEGVRHIWMPSTSFCIPDAIQTPLGQKRVAVGLLDLSPDGFEFELVTPAGMVRHNLLDHPEVYPQVMELSACLTDEARRL